MSCYSNCSATLPHGAVGWSAVCDCGITYHTRLLFSTNQTLMFDDTDPTIILKVCTHLLRILHLNSKLYFAVSYFCNICFYRQVCQIKVPAPKTVFIPCLRELVL